MIGILIAILIQFSALLIGWYINYRALISIFIRHPKNEFDRTGIAAFLSLATTILLLFRHQVLSEPINFLLFGGITGISYAGMRIHKKMAYIKDRWKKSETAAPGLGGPIIIYNYAFYASMGFILAYSISIIIMVVFPKSIF